MEQRYIRNIPALTEQECSLLRTKKIAVIGCGGLGGHIIEMLSRIGIGVIRAVDGDVFEESNLNRQLLSEVPLIGTSKAAAAAERIRRVNPDVLLEPIPAFLNKKTPLNWSKAAMRFLMRWTILPAENFWLLPAGRHTFPTSTVPFRAGLRRPPYHCRRIS